MLPIIVFTIHDILVYRYADALLMMAEIENGLGNPCANYINEIRKRAYGKNYSPAVAYAEGTYADNELRYFERAR